MVPSRCPKWSSRIPWYFFVGIIFSNEYGCRMLAKCFGRNHLDLLFKVHSNSTQKCKQCGMWKTSEPQCRLLSEKLTWDHNLSSIDSDLYLFDSLQVPGARWMSINWCHLKGHGDQWTIENRWNYWDNWISLPTTSASWDWHRYHHSILVSCGPKWWAPGLVATTGKQGVHRNVHGEGVPEPGNQHT